MPRSVSLAARSAARPSAARDRRRARGSARARPPRGTRTGSARRRRRRRRRATGAAAPPPPRSRRTAGTAPAAAASPSSAIACATQWKSCRPGGCRRYAQSVQRQLDVRVRRVVHRRRRLRRRVPHPAVEGLERRPEAARELARSRPSSAARRRRGRRRRAAAAPARRSGGARARRAAARRPAPHRPFAPHSRSGPRSPPQSRASACRRSQRDAKARARRAGPQLVDQRRRGPVGRDAPHDASHLRCCVVGCIVPSGSRSHVCRNAAAAAAAAVARRRCARSAAGGAPAALPPSSARARCRSAANAASHREGGDEPRGREALPKPMKFTGAARRVPAVKRAVRCRRRRSVRRARARARDRAPCKSADTLLSRRRW